MENSKWALRNEGKRSRYTGNTLSAPTEVVAPGSVFVAKTVEQFNDLILSGAGSWVPTSLPERVPCVSQVSVVIANLRLEKGTTIELSRQMFVALALRHFVKPVDEAAWSPEMPVDISEVRKFYDADSVATPKENWVTSFRRKVGV